MSQSLLAYIIVKLNRGDCPHNKWPDSRGEYWALCPFHADTHYGSFSVSERGYKCHSCGESGGLVALAKRLGIATEPPKTGCTLADYADLKHLAPGFLQSLGVCDGKYSRLPALMIPYRDSNGKTSAMRWRLNLHKAKSGKDNRFRWRKGAKLSLYGLWRLAEMRKAGWMLLVEGESDCHAAWSHDIPALGIPGAASWKPEWREHVAGIDVYVWQEPDIAGRAMVEKLRESLPNAKVIAAPDGTKDISDANARGTNIAKLLDELKQCATPMADIPQPEGASATHNTTDLGNARRLVALHGGDMLYCDALGGWLVWNGKRWATDNTGQVERYAKGTVASIYAEAAAQPAQEQREELASWATRSEALARIKAMIELSRTELGMMVTPAAFDADPWLLNVDNGTLDLRTGKLRQHNRADMITKLAPVAYDPDAQSATLDRYLATVTQGDAAFSAYLQRACGYSLTGKTDEECFFLMLGPAATGKSTLVEAMLTMLGDYGVKASFAAFLATKNIGGATPELVRLRGARLVAAVETANGSALNEALVKELTGGDSVTARALYCAPITFKPTFKLWLAANDSPKLTDTDSGIWRRLQRLPFEYEIPAAERDPRVKATLCAEAGPALLAWAVRGCLAWQRDRLGTCEIVLERTSELRADFDPLAEFFGGWCLFGRDAETPAQDLRHAYEQWAGSIGARPINNREWSKRLKAHGCESRRESRHGKQQTYWFGIGLLGDDTPPDDGPDAASHDSLHNLHNKRHLQKSPAAETVIGSRYTTAHEKHFCENGPSAASCASIDALTDAELAYVDMAEQGISP